tara:strand:+ start:736 stop:1002 length:267 start_codon:yes stop_codon:yes gene_type:complete
MQKGEPQTLEEQKEELESSMETFRQQVEVRKEMDNIREEGTIKENSVTDTHKIIYEAEKRISDRKKNEVLKVLEANEITNFYSKEKEI